MDDDDIARLLDDTAIKINDSIDPVLRSVRSRGDAEGDWELVGGGGLGRQQRSGNVLSNLAAARVKYIPRGLLPALPRLLAAHSAASLFGMWFLLHTPGPRELVPATAVALQEVLKAVLSALSFHSAAIRSNEIAVASLFTAPRLAAAEACQTAVAATLACCSALLLWSSVARLDAAVAAVAWEARAAWAGAAAASIAVAKGGCSAGNNGGRGLVRWAGISLVAAGCALAEKSNRGLAAEEEEARVEHVDPSAELETKSFEHAHHTGFALACAAAVVSGFAVCLAEVRSRNSAHSASSVHQTFSTSTRSNVDDGDGVPPSSDDGDSCTEDSESSNAPSSSSQPTPGRPPPLPPLSAAAEAAAEAAVRQITAPPPLSPSPAVNTPTLLLSSAEAGVWRGECHRAILSAGLATGVAAWQAGGVGSLLFGGGGGGGGGDDGDRCSGSGFFRCYTVLTWACVFLNGAGEYAWSCCLAGAAVEAAAASRAQVVTSLVQAQANDDERVLVGEQAKQQQQQQHPGRGRSRGREAVTPSEWREAQGVGGGVAVLGTTLGAALFLGGEGLSPMFLGGASLAAYGLLVFGAAAPLPSLDFFAPVGEEEAGLSQSEGVLIQNGQFVALE